MKINKTESKTYVYWAIISILMIGLISFVVFGIRTSLDNDVLNAKLKNSQDILESTKDELIATQDNLNIETKKFTELNEELNVVKGELEIANTTISDLKGSEYKFVYLGDFKLTHYCCEKREHICGTGNGLTATGTKVTAGKTIAVDPKVIPYGTKVYIEGYGWRTAEDCGGGVKGKHIDVAVNTHTEAMSNGIKTRGVWVLVKNNS